MSETATTETPQITPPPAPPAPPRKKLSKKNKRILVVAIVTILLAIGLVALFRFIFAPKEQGDILTEFASYSSIQSMVEGSGTTSAQTSSTITPTVGGKVLELYVAEGDYVTKGTKLYSMDDSTAQDALKTAQKNADNYALALQDLYDAHAKLNITAPFSGKLLTVAELKVGDEVAKGTKIATLVSDSKLKLSLYYSYAYEDSIKVGQSAQISVPSAMTNLTGTVSQINKVKRVTTEGSILFEVIFTFDNPGALTADMAAAAVLTDSSGVSIYPYEDGKLAYNQTKEITAEVAGPVESINLLNFANVSAGTTLVQLGSKTYESDVAAAELNLKSAQEKLETALEEFEKYNAVAPIDGTVISCTLLEGEDVASGQGITIADTTVMTIKISIDERNVSYVKPGMTVDINQWDNHFMGTVQSVSMTGTMAEGASTFPAVVIVDNTDGTLMTNMYVTYSLVASESDNCLVIPIQCVKTISLEDDSIGSVVFLKASQKPDNALELGDTVEVPDGFWPVPVTTGISDTYNVEITDGLQESDEVFLNYTTTEGSNW